VTFLGDIATDHNEIGNNKKKRKKDSFGVQLWSSQEKNGVNRRENNATNTNDNNEIVSGYDKV